MDTAGGQEDQRDGEQKKRKRAEQRSPGLSVAEEGLEDPAQCRTLAQVCSPGAAVSRFREGFSPKTNQGAMNRCVLRMRP